MVLNETVQYLECEHGFVWASDGMDGTMQPRCEREKCIRWIRMYRDAVMPAEAAEAPGYDATGDMDSSGTGENNGVSMGKRACKICDEVADEECQGGLCEGCCESNRGTGPFQCCDGHWMSGAWSSDESAESWEEGGETRETEIGEFIMWKGEDDEWIGGVVRAVEADKLRVHLMEEGTSGSI